MPLWRSIPTALLQLGLLVALVGGGWRRSRSGPAPPAPPAWWQYAGAGAAMLVAAVLMLWSLLAISSVAFAYRTPRTDVFSWEDNLVVTSVFLALAGSIALVELRAASGLLRGARWASVVIGLQVGALTAAIAVGVVDRVASGG